MILSSLDPQLRRGDGGREAEACGLCPVTSAAALSNCRSLEGGLGSGSEAWALTASI